MVRPVELRDPLAEKWVSKLTGGFAEPWTFGERVRDWLLAHADQFDVVHDNQTLADGILDLQRACLPVVTTIHHPITRDLRVALSAGRSAGNSCCPTLAFFSVNARPESRRN